jgi:hypothetical protein
MQINKVPDIEISVGLADGASHIDSDVVHPAVLVAAPEVIVMIGAGAILWLS